MNSAPVSAILNCNLNDDILSNVWITTGGLSFGLQSNDIYPVLESSTFLFKTYKVSFSFKGSRSLILIGNVVGVSLNNISNSLQTQNNLLGLLNVKLVGSLNAEVITNEEDNPVVYLKNLNNSSVLTVKIEILIVLTVNV